MTTHETGFNLGLSRRKLLAAAGIAGGAKVASALIGHAEAAPPAAESTTQEPTPPVAGLHLQFGADAVVARWSCPGTRCSRFAIRACCSGGLDGKLEQTVAGDAPSAIPTASPRQVVYAHHAKIGGLQARHQPILYGALHDGAEPEFGTFRTAPRGRAAFTFTSFGDQGTPTLGQKFVPPRRA